MWEKTKLTISKFLKNFFFNDTQRLILQECRLANKEEYSQWLSKNVVLPMIIIFLPVMIFLVFDTDVTDVKSLIFNGSISLLGVNILFGMSSYLIKVQKRKLNAGAGVEHGQSQEFDEGKLNEDVFYLRERLNIYKNILVVTGAAFYIVQKLFHTYKTDLGFYIFAVLTLVILTASINIGRLVFIIKDDFFEKTYFSELSKPVKDNRNRWTQKY